MHGLELVAVIEDLLVATFRHAAVVRCGRGSGDGRVGLVFGAEVFVTRTWRYGVGAWGGESGGGREGFVFAFEGWLQGLNWWENLSVAARGGGSGSGRLL